MILKPKNGTVFINSEFDIDAMNAGQDKLSDDTYVKIYENYMNLLQDIHTSCLQPLNAGDQFGSLKLEDMVLVS